LFGFYDFAGCSVAIVAADVPAAISHFMFMFRVNVAFHFPHTFQHTNTFPSAFSHQLRSAVQWLVC